jgi:nucleoside-diphosphate-sugar epimerase
MKILVIGGQGFVGSHLVDNLLARGHKIIIMDRLWKTGLWSEYGWEDKNVEFLLGDLKDEDSTREAVNRCDMWVNLGGLLGTSEMIHNPISAVKVNIIGALNVFDAARIYGKRGLQIAVGNYWMNNPYSISKNTAERFAQMYNKEHGTDIRVVRGMNIFGERQTHRPIRKIFPNVVIPALLNRPILIYGTGDQVMDLIYAKDFVEVLARGLLTDDAPNTILYESGVGGGMTINRAVELVLKATGSKSVVNRVAMRPGEDKQAVVEISEQGWRDLETHLGYTPSDLTSMDEAIEKTVRWYRDNLERFEWLD